MGRDVRLAECVEDKGERVTSTSLLAVYHVITSKPNRERSGADWDKAAALVSLYAVVKRVVPTYSVFLKGAGNKTGCYQHPPARTRPRANPRPCHHQSPFSDSPDFNLLGSFFFVPANVILGSSRFGVS